MHAPDLRVAVEAGLVAAFVSSLPGVAYVAATGDPPWRAVQLIATLVGVERLDRLDLVAFLLGGVLHLVISVALAVAFAAVVTTRSPRRSVALGAGWGALIWLVNFELTRLLGLANLVRAGTHDGVEFAAHLLYGASVGAWLAWRRRGSATG